MCTGTSFSLLLKGVISCKKLKWKGCAILIVSTHLHRMTPSSGKRYAGKNRKTVSKLLSTNLPSTHWCTTMVHQRAEYQLHDVKSNQIKSFIRSKGQWTDHQQDRYEIVYRTQIGFTIQTAWHKSITQNAKNNNQSRVRCQYVVAIKNA